MRTENGFTLSHRGGLVTIRRVRGRVAVENARASGLRVYPTDRAARDAALKSAGRDGVIRWNMG